MIYLDTGILCSLYCPDAGTEHAVNLVQRHRDRFAYVWIHQLEFRNALRLRVFRKEITARQRDGSLNLLLADIAAGLWVQAPAELPAVMTEAERLSALHSEKIGTRSLDILHVAAALVLGAERFLSLDARQRKLAKAVGLRVNAK